MGQMRYLLELKQSLSEALRHPPMFDDNPDDNADDTHSFDGAAYKAFLMKSLLFRARACCWQCGGQGFESP